MKRLILFPALLILSGLAFSQAPSSTLQSKWVDVIDRAESYEHYKVIKITSINELWKQVQDTLAKSRTDLKLERDKIAQQNQQIAQLQDQVKEVQGKLEATSTEKNSMGFIGMQVDKYAYTNTLWVLVLIVAGSCGVLFYLYTNSNKVTVQKIKEYDQLSQSFELYKQSKIEMERKLKREIQTYANSIEELKSKQRI